MSIKNWQLIHELQIGTCINASFKNKRKFILIQLKSSLVDKSELDKAFVLNQKLINNYCNASYLNVSLKNNNEIIYKNC